MTFLLKKLCQKITLNNLSTIEITRFITVYYAKIVKSTVIKK